jgi:alpha-methylacyl-CoA racemase
MPDPAPPAPGPLSGVTVLDLSAVGPASRCTRLLADYGATVVKVSPVPGRGPEQTAPPAWAYAAGRGTRRARIDVRHPEGRDALLALAGRADVFVESFRPGVADRLGIGYDDVRRENAAIVYVSTSGYGGAGTRSAWAGHDLDYLAVGGFLAMCEAAEDGRPPLPGATIADAAAGGMQAALAVCATLLRRAATGEGAHLDVSVADGVLWLMSLALEEHLATGAPVRAGHDVLSGRYACYGTYAAGDGGFLAVAAIEPKFFANLCRALDCDEWVDKQYDDHCQDALRGALAEAFARRPRDAWVEALAGADTCVAPVLDVDEVAADPHFASRGAFVEAELPSGSRVRQVGPVLAGMTPLADAVRLPGDATDTAELLLAAGVSSESVSSLLESGVVA